MVKDADEVLTGGSYSVGTQHRLLRRGPSAVHPAPPPSIAPWVIWLTWLAILVVPALIGAVAGYFAASVMPRIYAAQADIVFSLPDAAVPEEYRSTQVVVAKSHVVLQPVAVAAKIPFDRLALNLSADFPKSGGVLRLQYTDKDSSVALRVVEAVLDQYLVVLDQLDSLDNATYRLLTPPFAVEDPVAPRPTLIAALGAAFGLAIGLGALVLLINLRSAAGDGSE